MGYNAPQIYTYSHRVGSHDGKSGACFVDIDISAGRDQPLLVPAYVGLTAYSPDGPDQGYSDAFALRLVSKSEGSVRVISQRVGGPDNGWGMNLYVDVMIAVNV